MKSRIAESLIGAWTIFSVALPLLKAVGIVDVGWKVALLPLLTPVVAFTLVVILYALILSALFVLLPRRVGQSRYGALTEEMSRMETAMLPPDHDASR